MKQAVALILQSVPEVWAIYLYGSAAAGALRADSDIDLAVLARELASAEALRALQMDLADVLQRDVDLVDLRAIPLTLAAQILEGGKLIAVPNAKRTAAMETSLMAQYANLNEERREILADIRARGSVYGR